MHPQPKTEPEAEPRNEVAAIIAGTWEHEGGDTFFTLGGEYERRITSRFGVTGEVEYLFDADQWVVAGLAVFHSGYGVKLFAGPGFERADVETSESELLAGGTPERANHFLFRIGAGYALEFAHRYSIGPSVSFDVVRENETRERGVVFGMNVGVTF
ncbi:MAG TPA: hypothetical protein VGF24_00120 [Vicinamibacterales bacterium]